MNKGLISLMMMAIPLTAGEYDQLYIVLLFVGIFTLLFVVIYLMVGEEREETES